MSRNRLEQLLQLFRDTTDPVVWNEGLLFFRARRICNENRHPCLYSTKRAIRIAAELKLSELTSVFPFVGITVDFEFFIGCTCACAGTSTLCSHVVALTLKMQEEMTDDDLYSST